MVRRLMPSLLGLTFVACGGVVGGSDVESGSSEDPTGSELPPIQAICDGSDDVRLSYAVMNGIASFQQYPYGRFDSSFFAIDGRCNYWFGGDGSIRGIQGGRFDAERGRRLSQELQFGRYSSVAGFRRTEVCLDGGLERLSDGTGVIQDACGGLAAAAPVVWSKAFEGLRALWSEIEELGEPRWEPTRLLVLRVGGASSPADAALWTAPLDLERHAADLEHYDAQPKADSFAVTIEDEVTLAVLARLRGDALAADAHASSLVVRDASGRFYQLHVRDVGPAKVVTALQSLLTTPEN